MENFIYTSTVKIAGSPALVNFDTGEILGSLNSLYRFKSDNGKSIAELVQREFNLPFKA